RQPAGGLCVHNRRGEDHRHRSHRRPRTPGRARPRPPRRQSRLSAVVLRGGIEVASPLDVAVGYLDAWSGFERLTDASGAASFDERGLRLANRGGARISAAEIAAILERRRRIVRALAAIPPDASLAQPAASIPWAPLAALFDQFAGIR